jgi:two-component SAPR family response regulator
MDVLLKGLDGFELYNNMRNMDENVQVCFITASSTFFEKYKKLYPGIEKECFIQKPTTIKKLATIIDSILENRRQA